MPFRRSHRKSTFGCMRCKKRHIKCDENRPKCGACQKKGLVCDYGITHSLASTPTSQDSLQSSNLIKENAQCACSMGTSFARHPGTIGAQQVPALNSQSLPMTVDIPGDRLLELRLMHHYTSMSSTSFAPLFESHVSTPKAHQLFCNWSTHTAFQNPSAMNTLLSFSAFTLRQLHPLDKALSQASHQYLRRAIESHAAKVQKGITHANADALFLGSILIAYTIVSGLQYLSSAEEMSSPVAWFEPWKGVRTIFFAAIEWLSGPDIDALIRSELESMCLDDIFQCPVPVSQSNPFFFLLDGLEVSNVDEETFIAYTNAIHHLQRIYRSKNNVHAFRFASGSEPRFTQLLKERDPRALTMLGYFLMLMRKVKRLWWLPEATVEMFENVMELLPIEYLPQMEWAVKEFYGSTEERASKHAYQSGSVTILEKSPCINFSDQV